MSKNRLFRSSLADFNDEELLALLPVPAPPQPATGVIRLFRGHFLFFDEDQTPVTMAAVVQTITPSSGRGYDGRQNNGLREEDDTFLLLLN